MLFSWYYMTTAWTYKKAGLFKELYRAANPCPFGCTNSCITSKCPHRLSVRLQRCLSNTSIGKTYIDEGLQTTRKHFSNSYPNIRAYFYIQRFLYLVLSTYWITLCLSPFRSWFLFIAGFHSCLSRWVDTKLSTFCLKFW